MSEYKAIALDMDGTLLTRDHKISSATRAALAQARAHGIKVLLVTGRHFMTARPFHHELALDTPIICSNGAYLYDPVQERILAGDPLAVAPLTELLAQVEAQQMGALFHLSEGIGYIGCEDHITRMRHWSANQPDHLKISLLPAACGRSGELAEKSDLEAGAVQPGSCPAASVHGAGGRGHALYP